MNVAAKVVVVDDEPAVRNALIRLLSSAGFDATGMESPRKLLEDDVVNEFDCLLVDLEMPDMSGIELQRALKSSQKDCPIIFVSGHADVPASVAAMKDGAVDFLMKPVDADCLFAALDSALSQSEQRRYKREEIDELRTHYDNLTMREKQVFHGVVAGQLNKQIGANLGTSEKTIKVQRARVMEKMAAHNVAELVIMATKLFKA
jgi:FixJ family two-component response regulator